MVRELFPGALGGEIQPSVAPVGFCLPTGPSCSRLTNFTCMAIAILLSTEKPPGEGLMYPSLARLGSEGAFITEGKGRSEAWLELRLMGWGCTQATPLTHTPGYAQGQDRWPSGASLRGLRTTSLLTLASRWLSSFQRRDPHTVPG